jgi:hypothetical protein
VSTFLKRKYLPRLGRYRLSAHQCGKENKYNSMVTLDLRLSPGNIPNFLSILSHSMKPPNSKTASSDCLSFFLLWLTIQFSRDVFCFLQSTSPCSWSQYGHRSLDKFHNLHSRLSRKDRTMVRRLRTFLCFYPLLRGIYAKSGHIVIRIWSK